MAKTRRKVDYEYFPEERNKISINIRERGSLGTTTVSLTKKDLESALAILDLVSGQNTYSSWYRA